LSTFGSYNGGYHANMTRYGQTVVTSALSRFTDIVIGCLVFML